jgi:hypothetical protein
VVGKLTGRDNFKNFILDERMVLKWSLKSGEVEAEII